MSWTWIGRLREPDSLLDDTAGHPPSGRGAQACCFIGDLLDLGGFDTPSLQELRINKVLSNYL